MSVTLANAAGAGDAFDVRIAGVSGGSADGLPTAPATLARRRHDDAVVRPAQRQPRSHVHARGELAAKDGLLAAQPPVTGTVKVKAPRSRSVPGDEHTSARFVKRRRSALLAGVVAALAAAGDLRAHRGRGDPDPGARRARRRHDEVRHRHEDAPRADRRRADPDRRRRPDAARHARARHRRVGRARRDRRAARQADRPERRRHAQRAGRRRSTARRRRWSSTRTSSCATPPTRCGRS